MHKFCSRSFTIIDHVGIGTVAPMHQYMHQCKMKVYLLIVISDIRVPVLINLYAKVCPLGKVQMSQVPGTLSEIMYKSPVVDRVRDVRA